MSKKSILKKQTVRKKKRSRRPVIGRWILLLVSHAAKFAFLFVGLVGVSIVFLSIYEYLQTSPHIKLERVVVTGVDEGLKKELIRMTRLDYNRSLLAIDIFELKRKLKDHPWVRSVQVEKHFPHSLLIHAEKEVPRALVALDRIVYMNRWGEIFKELEKDDDVDYPIVTGVSKIAGERRDQLQLAAYVFDVLESEVGPWSLKDLSELHIGENGHVSLYSITLPAVVKLKGRELEIKKAAMRRVITHLSNSGLIHSVLGIDLNYRDSAAVSLRKG